jgi:hypothetical protein
MSRSRYKRADLHEGQHWDEVGSPVVNARTRTITMLGTKRVTYKDEVNRLKTILITSFLRWANVFAESNQVKE